MMKKLLSLFATLAFGFLLYGEAKATVLNWTDNSSIETGTLIFRADNALGPFANIGQVGPNVTTYDDTTGTEGQCYYVVAITANRNSEPSNVRCKGPNSPTNLVVQ